MFALAAILVLLGGDLCADSVDLELSSMAGNPKIEGKLLELTAQPPGRPKPLSLPVSVPSMDNGKIVVILEPEPEQPSASIDTAAVSRLGGQILAQSEHLIRAAVPIFVLDEVAAAPGVHFIRRPMRPLRHGKIREGTRCIGALENHQNADVFAVTYPRRHRQ